MPNTDKKRQNEPTNPLENWIYTQGCNDLMVSNSKLEIKILFQFGILGSEGLRYQ